MRCAAVGLVLLAGAAAASEPDDPSNAATWYRKAFERYSTVRPTNEEWDVLDAYDPTSGKQPPEAVRAILARMEPVFIAMRRGAAEQSSDFGLDFHQGYEMLMPHLGQVREIQQWMRWDAGVHLYDGDPAGAADSIASLYRLCGHVGQDDVLISSLVGQSIFRGVDQLAQYGLDSGAFSPGECGKLLAALEAMPARDPFNVIGALGNEQMMTGWLRDKFADPQSRAALPDFLGVTSEARRLDDLLLLDDAQFDAAVDGASELMGQVVDVFMLDDPDEARLELKCLEEETMRGEHGLIAAMVIPAYGQVYDNLVRAREDLVSRAGVLRAVASGERSPSELVNGAEWYLRAVELIRQLDAEFRGQLPGLVTGPKAVDAKASQRLVSASAIVDTLRAGSQAPRCDFSIVLGPPRVVPDYLPGLREAFWLLQADALRLVHDGDREQALDRLVIAWRMAAHLSGDPQLTVALVAHAGFQGTAAIVRQVLTMDDSQRAALVAALKAMPARDPFGYMGAFERGRRDVLKGLKPGAGTQFAFERMLKESDGDRLLYLLAVATQRDDETDRSSTWPPLSDVLSLDALSAARSGAAAAKARLADGDVTGLVPDPLPEIGHVRERFAKAMEEYRAALAELEAAGAADRTGSRITE